MNRQHDAPYCHVQAEVVNHRAKDAEEELKRISEKEVVDMKALREGETDKASGLDWQYKSTI